MQFPIPINSFASRYDRIKPSLEHYIDQRDYRFASCVVYAWDQMDFENWGHPENMREMVIRVHHAIEAIKEVGLDCTQDQLKLIDDFLYSHMAAVISEDLDSVDLCAETTHMLKRFLLIERSHPTADSEHAIVREGIQRYASGILAIALLIAILPLPYAYYQLLRFGSMVGFGWFCYEAKKNNLMVHAWLLGGFALLFNPIIPVHMDREVWMLFDLGGVVLLGSTWYRLSDNKSEFETPPMKPIPPGLPQGRELLADRKPGVDS